MMMLNTYRSSRKDMRGLRNRKAGAFTAFIFKAVIPQYGAMGRLVTCL